MVAGSTGTKVEKSPGFSWGDWKSGTAANVHFIRWSEKQSGICQDHIQEATLAIAR